MKSKILLLIIAFLLLEGCGPYGGRPYNIFVNGLAAQEQIESNDQISYILIPANKNVSINDLQFQEFAEYIKRALSIKGYVYTEDYKDASIAVLVTYGISDPQENLESYLIPTWGQTGVSGSYTQGHVSTGGNFSGTTTYTPTYGVTGYVSGVRSHTTYTRGLSLSAYDLQAYLQNSREIELWRTVALSTGMSGDLRKVMPILVTAIQPFLGTRTLETMHVTHHENDDAVVKIRGRRLVE